MDFIQNFIADDPIKFYLLLVGIVALVLLNKDKLVALFNKNNTTTPTTTAQVAQSNPVMDWLNSHAPGHGAVAGPNGSPVFKAGSVGDVVATWQDLRDKLVAAGLNDAVQELDAMFKDLNPNVVPNVVPTKAAN